MNRHTKALLRSKGFAFTVGLAIMGAGSFAIAYGLLVAVS